MPSPVVADGLVFVCGAKRNPFLAFHDCGAGDVTTQPDWRGVPSEYTTDCATPLLYQDKLFMLDGDHQIMVCFEPATGKVIWKQSLGVHEIFRASPTGADGKIYCFSEYATAVVLSAAEGQVLSTIKMSEGNQTDNEVKPQHNRGSRKAAFLFGPLRTYIALPKSSSPAMTLPYKIATLLYCFNRQDQALLLLRAREPNRGLWSPCGGKLHMDAGESPYACACREAMEEITLPLTPGDLHLTGIVSEHGYEGQAHWLMFLFEVIPRLEKVPPPIREGEFRFFDAAEIANR